MNCQGPVITLSGVSVRGMGLALRVCRCHAARVPDGEVAEWFMALVLKTSVGESLPWVRIPPSPPSAYAKAPAGLAGDALGRRRRMSRQSYITP